MLKAACRAHTSFLRIKGQCNPSLWIKTCAQHRDSGYTARISANSSGGTHTTPLISLHLNRWVVSTSLKNTLIFVILLFILHINYTRRSLSVEKNKPVHCDGGRHSVCRSLWSTRSTLQLLFNIHPDLSNWVSHSVHFITPNRNSIHTGL